MTKANLLALGASALALALAGCNQAADNATAAANGSTAAAVAPPAGQDWTQVVSQTPEGGFVMGNPNAPVKLVEYLSLTCPHCAQFAETGYPQLQEYVKKGTLSLELRNYVRDPIDVTATLVTRCGGAPSYFAMTEQALAQQGQILDAAQKLPQDQLQRLQSAPPADQFKSLASMLGIDQFAKQRGVPQAKLDQCFADKAALDQLVAMQKKANEIPNFAGTPTFLLNGTMLQNAGTWEQLEPQLKQAGA
jgi:protein-disulfide isomerase